MDSTSSQRKIPRPKYLRNGREQVTALSALALLVVAQPKRCSLDTLLHIKRKHFLCVEGPVFFAVRKVRAPRRSNGTCAEIKRLASCTENGQIFRLLRTLATLCVAAQELIPWSSLQIPLPHNSSLSHSSLSRKTHCLWEMYWSSALFWKRQTLALVINYINYKKAL